MAKLKMTRWTELVYRIPEGEARVIGNNTVATHDYVDGRHVIVIRLHGHAIVRFCAPSPTAQPNMAFTLAGWPTVTTRERVNQFIAIHGWRVIQSDWTQYITGVHPDPFRARMNPDAWYTIDADGTLRLG
jgi:hypothetical protein